MKAYFEDKEFDFQLLRMLGSTVAGAADIGECLSTAQRIKEGDFEGWYAAWNETAERLRAVADDCYAKGHAVSAHDTYLRASNYYRCAEFYLHGDQDDPRISEVSDKSMDCFRKVFELTPFDMKAVEIPYESTTLPGYLYRPGDSGTPKPALILMTGFDGTQEEFYGSGMAATARGFNLLTFEGPGQGKVIREQGFPFRPDWEKVIAPVVDFLLTLDDVDPKKIALEGLSFGGYLAPRAAAFEHRLAACIANGGVFDFIGSRIPPGMTRDQLVSMMRDYPKESNENMQKMMDEDVEMRWSIEHGMYVFKVPTPAEWFLKASEYTMEGVAEKIECPTLVIDVENEFSFTGEAKKLYDALACPKTWMFFSEEEGAGEHCQIAGQALSGQRVFDWLEETLDVKQS